MTSREGYDAYTLYLGIAYTSILRTITLSNTTEGKLVSIPLSNEKTNIILVNYTKSIRTIYKISILQIYLFMTFIW